MPNKAVFLDRDHTLIEDPGYINEPAAVKLLPGVELALKSLAQAGYKLIVVTNQSGVARGLLSEQTLEKIHAEMTRQLAEKGARLDGIYYCPFHPEGTVHGYAMESDLRKPKPGMLLKAARDFDLDLSASWMVGDSGRDVEAGQRAGCRAVRIRIAAHQAGEIEDEDVQADFSVRNLVDAARVILREAPRARPGVQGGKTCEGASEESASGEPESGAGFDCLRLAGMLAQVLAAAALVIGACLALAHRLAEGTFWMAAATALQAMALTAMLARRDRRA